MSGVVHDCVLVERDNLELHQALAEALRRLSNARRTMEQQAPLLLPELAIADLLAVLDKTARRGRGGDVGDQAFSVWLHRSEWATG